VKPFLLAAALAASALTLTACASQPQPPYHRNATDRTACHAYQTAVSTDTGADWVYAITDSATATPPLGDLVVAAQERYGDQNAPVTWCDQHGYPVSLP
jgi:hypothetical protein